MQIVTGRTLLTLAIASRECHDIQPFLDALERTGMAGANDVEIRLACLPALIPAANRRPANLYFHPCESGASVFKQWGEAIAAGHGEWIATLDACCPPSDTWWQAVRQAINADTPLFFGPVDAPRQTGSTLAWLTEYAQFSDPISTGPHDVPGINIVLRRDCVPDIDRLRANGFIKILVLWQCDRERQLRARAIDGMRIQYERPWTLSTYMSFRHSHGRHFGLHRHKAHDQPPRWLCITGCPILPALRVWRIWRQAGKHFGVRRKVLSQLLPLILSETAWSLGELLGYLDQDRN